MKKIVYFCQRWTSGGIESLITKILSNINDDNIYKILVSQKESDVYDLELKKNNIEMIILNSKNTKKPLKRNLNSFKSFIKYLKLEKPDIIHINLYNAMSMIYGYLSRNKAKKILLHAHNNGFDNDRFGIKKVINNFSKKVFRSNKFEYIACSKEAAKFCFSKKNANNTTIINNGIDLNSFCFNKKIRDSYRKKMNIEKNFVVCNIGRFVEQKNQIRLLEIFEKIYKLESSAKLILIGEGELEANIRQRAKELKIYNRIIFLKKRSDISNILQAVDVFIFPSLYEGYGIVAIEAQAAGLPTFISSNLSQEIFASELAFKFDLNSKNDEIANNIIKCKLIDRNSPALKEYDIKYMVKILLKIYYN